MKVFDLFIFKFIRAFLFTINFISMTIVLYIGLKFINLFKLKVNNLSYVIKVQRFFLSLLFWIKVEIEKEKTYDKYYSNIIFASNHISYIDSLYLSAYLTAYLSKNKHFNVLISNKYINFPLYRYILKCIETIPVGNKEYNKKTDINGKIIEYLTKGNNLGIYFEGSRNNNPTKLQTIKPGIFNYHKYSNGIKFIGIKGIDKIWPAYGYPTGYGTIKIKFFDGLYKFDTFEETQDKIHELYDNYIKV